jgi:hypothetical protein
MMWTNLDNGIRSWQHLAAFPLLATVRRVREEHVKLGQAGHYGRPDVLYLKINRERQERSARITDDSTFWHGRGAHF